MRRTRLFALLCAVLVIVGCASVAGTSQASTPETLFGDQSTGIVTDPDTTKTVVGVQFKAAVAGTVTAIRYYKSATTTGTHVGKLAKGTTVLSSATFTGETASGWQQVTLPTPVAVSAGQTYTAYYTANNGRYAVGHNYSWPKVSGNLTGIKGVYTFNTSQVPSKVYQSENYYVDVVFEAATVPTPTPTPTPTSASPTPTSAVEPTPTTTVEPTPTTTTPPPAPVGYSILNDATPTSPASVDPTPVTLGTVFRTDTPGTVTELRMYRGPGDTAAHVGNLWATGGGAVLGTATFPASGVVGWQTVALPAAVPVSPGGEYTVAFAAAGQYPADQVTYPRVNQSLTAVRGVYVYGDTEPTNVFQSSLYYADVTYVPDAGATPTPTPTTTAPPVTTTTPDPTTTVPPTTTTPNPDPTSPLNLPLIPWAGGPAYWAQFPDAVKAGWDKPDFFPVGNFWDFWPGGNNAAAKAAVQWDKDHGINFYTHGNADQDACVLRDVGGMSWLGAPGTLQNLDTCGANVWPGNYLEDEIDGTSGSHAAAFAKLASVSATARQQTPDKFVGVNYTSIPIQYWTSEADGGRYVNDTFADMISTDDYLFSTPNRCNAGNPNWFPFIGPKPLSLETCRQGQSYGRLTDSLIMRDALDTPRKPLSAFIDIYGGADPAVAVQTPKDVKAAAVSNIIHGAGFVIWFPLSFHPGCSTNRLMDASVPACAAAHTEAAGEVNNQIKSWAPILNTQSYQYTFGPGLDTSLKWHDGSVYIFAMTDGGAGDRTFTLPSSGPVPSTVTETISGRVIPVSGGTFTDTFAESTDYRVYRY